MKEYIERKALLDLYQIDGPENETGHVPLPVIRQNILDMPSTDVVEVRHGRWIPEACESVSKRNRLIEYRVYSCSICGRSNGRVKKRYCPNCGARMDKEDEHEVS